MKFGIFLFNDVIWTIDSGLEIVSKFGSELEIQNILWGCYIHLESDKV